MCPHVTAANTLVHTIPCSTVLHAAGGAILCVDVQFADWFGLSPTDCLGRAFSSLAVDPDILSA